MRSRLHPGAAPARSAARAWKRMRDEFVWCGETLLVESAHAAAALRGRQTVERAPRTGATADTRWRGRIPGDLASHRRARLLGDLRVEGPVGDGRYRTHGPTRSSS